MSRDVQSLGVEVHVILWQLSEALPLKRQLLRERQRVVLCDKAVLRSQTLLTAVQLAFQIIQSSFQLC